MKNLIIIVTLAIVGQIFTSCDTLNSFSHSGFGISIPIKIFGQTIYFDHYTSFQGTKDWLKWKQREKQANRAAKDGQDYSVCIVMPDGTQERGTLRADPASDAAVVKARGEVFFLDYFHEESTYTAFPAYKVSQVKGGAAEQVTLQIAGPKMCDGILPALDGTPTSSKRCVTLLNDDGTTTMLGKMDFSGSVNGEAALLTAPGLRVVIPHNWENYASYAQLYRNSSTTGTPVYVQVQPANFCE